MNLKEGTRRLGIVLGILGGVLGTFIAYQNGVDLWHTHVAHKRFESLLGSPTMLKVVKTEALSQESLSTAALTSDASMAQQKPPAEQQYSDLPKGAKIVFDPKSTSPPLFDMSKAKPIDYDALAQQVRSKSSKMQLMPPAGYVEVPPPQKLRAGESLVVPVNRDGIQEVTFDTIGVSVIQLSTGESVLKTESPALWAFAVLFLYPVNRFFGALGFTSRPDMGWRWIHSKVAHLEPRSSLTSPAPQKDNQRLRESDSNQLVKPARRSPWHRAFRRLEKRATSSSPEWLRSALVRA